MLLVYTFISHYPFRVYSPEIILKPSSANSNYTRQNKKPRPWLFRVVVAFQAVLTKYEGRIT